MGISALRMFFSGNRSSRQSASSDWTRVDGYPEGRLYGVVSHESFVRMLAFERKRTERSGKPFMLMLVDVRKCLPTNDKEQEKVLLKLLSALASSTRETDVTGWYSQNSFIGVILTEIGTGHRNSIPDPFRARVASALQENLGAEKLEQIDISFHLFPEEKNERNPSGPADLRFYPDLLRRNGAKRWSRFIKRTMDIVGCVLALVLFSPLFVAIALAIKVSSKGPILFRQPRVGQYGATFACLKFRSMHLNGDRGMHKEYVRRFISEKPNGSEKEDAVYKITTDPRVTRVGRFLRKSSLDEFPQFWNVLKGEMSLVGPRPPLPYELEEYDTWHKRRVLEVKPGITGLWQVTGRSRTTFAEMVRLDLSYAKTWSPWLDIKILLQTPRAVLSGEGAY